MTIRQAQARIRLRLIKLKARKSRAYTLDAFFRDSEPDSLVPFFNKESVFKDFQQEYYQ